MMIKNIILSAILTTGAGASQADIVAMGYDESEKALLALTDIPCGDFNGNIAAAMVEENREEFVGCWTGDGDTIRLLFPLEGFMMEYKSSMFKVLSNEWTVTEGTIKGTI